MPHFNRQHEPTDINEAVVITQAQLNDLKQFLTDLHDRSAAPPIAAPPIAAMSDAQFAELRGLLQPGFELSKLYLAQVRAAQGAPGAPVVTNPGNPLTDEQIAAEQEATDRARTPFRLDDKQERLDTQPIPNNAPPAPEAPEAPSDESTDRD